MLRLFTRAQSAWMRLRDERGASAIEYALLVAFIAGIVIAAVTLLGSNASNKINSVGTQLK